jgi:flagellar hook-associated protein 1 FlgK
MGLSAAMSAALSGLRASQIGLDVVADNVSNAGSAGYTRKTLGNTQQVIAGETNGVRVGEVTRSLDTLLQRQMLAENSGSGYTATKLSYHDRLDQLYGTPGGAGSLDTVVNEFTKSLQALVTSPDTYTARSEVLNTAQLLAQHLNGMSDDVQLMRTEAEATISTKIDRVNQLLENIARLNEQIVSQGAGGAPPAGLADERDRVVSELSTLMDIRVVPREDNKIAIFTTSGTMLFDKEPALLSFDARGSLDATTLYSQNTSERGVGTIVLTSPNGFQIDMIADKQFRSGEIAALVELRDRVLVEAQNQLDTLAASLSTALSNRTVAGEPAASAGQTGFSLDLTGMQNGNEIRISYVSGGQSRQAVFVPVDPSTPLPLSNAYSGGSAVPVIGFTGGAIGAVAAIQAQLGAGFSVTSIGESLTILDDGAANTTDVTGATASITNTTTNGPGPEIPLFLDGAYATVYTGELDGVPQKRGYAARIGVNQEIVSDRSLLVKMTAATPNGDATRPKFLYDALTKTETIFPPDTGIGGAKNPYKASVTSFARQIVETQGANAATAQNLDSGQQVVVKSLEDRFKQESGVNIDTEMALLLQLQNAYAANARVMTTVKEMLDLLLRM